jgi:sulfur-carrier protein adenylyltransferase/sulfurtransferase
MKTAEQLLSEVKARITETGAGDALALHGRDASVVFLDVRDPEEANLGKIPRAIHISRGRLETRIEAAVPRSATVVIYCANGNRSAFAAETLRQMGYEQVSSLREGFRGWVEAGGDVE